jgi:hypothetical protein
MSSSVQSLPPYAAPAGVLVAFVGAWTSGQFSHSEIGFLLLCSSALVAFLLVKRGSDPAFRPDGIANKDDEWAAWKKQRTETAASTKEQLAKQQAADGDLVCANKKCWEDCAGKAKCSRCKAVRYCSQKCQKTHWKLHKPECDRTHEALAARKKREAALSTPFGPVLPPAMRQDEPETAATDEGAGGSGIRTRANFVNGEGQCPVCLGSLENAVSSCDVASHACCRPCADSLRRNNLPQCPGCRPPLSDNFGTKEEANEHLYRAIELRLQAERLPEEEQGDVQRKALALLERVIGMDPTNTKAQNNLGCIYEKGTGVPVDHKVAIKWYGAAAEQGDHDALCNLGLMYAKGVGVTQNFHNAADLYRKAAEMGAADAQLNLGAFYYHGAGVEQDFKKAVDWYRKAAVQGDADAQCNLAICYHKGEGVAVDKEKALQWAKKSGTQGQEQALRILTELNQHPDYTNTHNASL